MKNLTVSSVKILDEPFVKTLIGYRPLLTILFLITYIDVNDGIDFASIRLMKVIQDITRPIRNLIAASWISRLILGAISVASRLIPD
ncbi:MAG: hypothetical protein WAO19_10645 [Candidatus Kryptoniota bacterium]